MELRATRHRNLMAADAGATPPAGTQIDLFFSAAMREDVMPHSKTMRCLSLVVAVIANDTPNVLINKLARAKY
jgi:hypothetical protein